LLGSGGGGPSARSIALCPFTLIAAMNYRDRLAAHFACIAGPSGCLLKQGILQ
jgi:hypothetical protein